MLRDGIWNSCGDSEDFFSKNNGPSKKTWICTLNSLSRIGATGGFAGGWWHRTVQSRKKSGGRAWHKDDMHEVRWMPNWNFSSIFIWEALFYLVILHPFGTCLPASIEGRLRSSAKSGITTSAVRASSCLKLRLFRMVTVILMIFFVGLSDGSCSRTIEHNWMILNGLGAYVEPGLRWLPGVHSWYLVDKNPMEKAGNRWWLGGIPELDPDMFFHVQRHIHIEYDHNYWITRVTICVL